MMMGDMAGGRRMGEKRKFGETTAYGAQQPSYTSVKRVLTDDARRNLIVNFLPPSVDSDYLSQLFGVCGEIERAHVVTDDNGTSKCFGFVKFVSPQSATDAIRRYDQYEIEGKRLRVAISQTPRQEVFLSGFGPTMTEAGLRQISEVYGQVVSIRMLDTQEHPRGVCFLKFSSPAEAVACIEGLNGTMYGDSQLVARYPKDNKQRQQMQQQMQQMPPAHSHHAPMHGGKGGKGAPMGAPQWDASGMMAMMGAYGQGYPQQPFYPAAPAMHAHGMPTHIGHAAPAPHAMGGHRGHGQDGRVTLFVHGLIGDSVREHATVLFGGYGAVDYDVPLGPDGRTKNFCFVHFNDQGSAQMAMDKLNGHVLPTGKALRVSFRGQQQQ